MTGIKIKNLSKSYKNNKVLDNINIEIDKPGVYLLAGPNGSGKTTLLEILAGLRNSDSGEISIDGKKIDSLEVKRKLGFLCQQNNLRKSSTVKEELQLVKDLYSIDIDEYEYLKKFNLEKYYKDKTKQLSGGTKRRLLIAMLFMAKQEIVVLDEPVSGLDTFSRDEIWNMISEYSKSNIVIVSDHYLNQAGIYSDYIFFINKGKIILIDTFTKIKETCKSSQLIKVRKEFFDDVKNIVSKHCKDFEVRLSGTVYNIFINDKNSDVFQYLEGKKITKHDIDLEDIYFYHTGMYSKEEVIEK